MVTLEAWILYAAARGLPVASDPLAAAALVRASDYIRLTYGSRFVRTPPQEVIDEATYIAAQYELQTPNFFGRVHVPGETNRMLTRAGELSWSPIRTPKGADATRPTVPTIEALLRPYLWRGPAMVVI
jgi:hypothetical protein